MSPCHIGPVVLVCPCLGNRGLGIHLHARERRERERSGMVDLRVETASLGDKTEFTETKDQSHTHHGSTLGTDPSGKAAKG